MNKTVTNYNNKTQKSSEVNTAETA